MPRHSPYALVRLNFLHRSFDLCCSLNCLSFFVHIFRFAVKKLSLSHRFFRLVSCGSLRSPLVEIVFYPTLLKDQYFLNIMSSISVRFYSFSSIRFSMIMVCLNPGDGSFIVCAFIPTGDTDAISDTVTRDWLSALPTGWHKWTRTTDLALIRRAL